MKFATVCSGIGAPELAWQKLGWEPQWFSEIEPFPCAVLQHHYPNVPNLGDMTKIHEKEIFNNTDINVLCGGTPCQSFSIAGLRKGLDDPRGNLALTFLSIVDRKRPRWVVWENVPGVLSSNGGRDFGSFLGGLEKLGYGFAYRVLDAQYFGVPQRRRRVFVVGYLGDWRRAAAVLFERESLSRNPPPRREKGQEVAGTLRNRSQSRGISSDGGDGHLIVWPAEIASTLNASFGEKLGLENQHIDSGAPLFVYGIPGNWIGRKPENWGNSTEPMENVAPCLTGTDRHAISFSQNQIGEVRTSEIMGTLNTNSNASGRSTPMIFQPTVRRLTPRECERLQGSPDDFTLLTGKTADGPRYKSIGNSMAVPVLSWIGKRIDIVEKLTIEA